MKLNFCGSPDFEGQRPGVFGKMFDGDGNEIEPVAWCDTETGEVKRWDIITANMEGRNAYFDAVHKAPLRFVPNGEEK